MKKFLFKKGYYSFYKTETKYVVDSGKTILLSNSNKTVVNSNRDEKKFKTLDEAKKYVTKKLLIKRKKKTTKLKKLPKSLYLILIKEESTKSLFVKVGITSKRFISRRFSHKYGYEGYTVDTILRKVVTTYKNAEELEKKILTELNRRRTVKKYRPVMESFSGYSECYNYINLKDIIKIFDNIVTKYKKTS